MQVSFLFPFFTFSLGMPFEYTRDSTQKIRDSTPKTSVTRPLSAPQVFGDTQVAELTGIVDALSEKGIQLLLILDRVSTADDLKHLNKVMRTPNVRTLVTTNNLDLNHWRSEIPDVRYVHYIPCIWSCAQETLDNLLLNRPERDTQEIRIFIHYLEFYARGRPGLLERSLTESEFYVRHLKTPELQLPTERLRKIESIARIQEALRWDQILQDVQDKAGFWGEYELDQIRTEIYNLIEFAIKTIPVSKRNLMKRALSGSLCRLLGRAQTRKTIDNLAQTLQQAGVAFCSRLSKPTNIATWPNRKQSDSDTNLTGYDEPRREFVE